MHRRIPVRGRHVDKRRRLEDPGVVHQGIDPAEEIDTSPYDFGAHFRVSKIGYHSFSSTADLLELSGYCLRLGSTTRTDQDTVAASGEVLCARATNSSGSSGDNHAPACVVFGVGHVYFLSS
ncbi:hypothetical protein GCM10027038_11000 [Arthrobacter bambusae]